MTCHRGWTERTGVPGSFAYIFWLPERLSQKHIFGKVLVLDSFFRFFSAPLTSVSSESEGDGDESFEEVGGVPSRVGWCPQGLGEVSRSTDVPIEGGPRGGQDIGL